MKKKISQIFKKIIQTDLSIKMKIISLIFIFGVLTFCLTTYFKTYTEYVSNPNNLHGIIDQTVYVNDADSDWYYYMGLNYTSSNNGTLPTTTNKNIYSENNLVETTVTYSATDILYNQTATVSHNENQNQYVYYKYYPVNNAGTANDNTDDYIEIELIDFPFANRPNNLAFNGWITSYNGAIVSYDADYYTRYAKVPVTYSNNKPSHISITFNTSWVTATVGTMTNNWSNAFGALKAAGMQALVTKQTTYNYNIYMEGYYRALTIARYTAYAGYYDAYGNQYDQSDGTCPNRRGCTVYESMEDQIYNANQTYYQVINGYMQTINNSSITFPSTTSIVAPFSATSIMAGFYRQDTINYGDSLVGYYTNTGAALNGTCPNTTCTYYKLIQYRDGTATEVIDLDKTYYYLVTRDTNIINMTQAVTGTWSTSTTGYDRPFTLTSLHNGTYRGSVWTTSNVAVKCYADARIEYLVINSGTSYTNTSDPSGGASQSRFFYGRYNNVKLGRGITRSGSNGNFLTVVGGDNSTTSRGSSNDLVKYKLMVESGFYSSAALTNSANSGSASNATYYMRMKAVYGNDYDRVGGTNGTNNNNNLVFYYCAGAAWKGYYYSDSTSGILFDLTVKSGTFGTNANYNNMYYAGIYVGSQIAGDTYAAKRIKVDGGYIFNLIGGPLVDDSIKDYNDIYIYMTGGSVDMINAGAGISETSANKIIQVTGGRVNYSIFGGSNASMTASNTNPGTLRGDSYIYVGGKGEVGDPNNLNATLWGAEAGSIFGAGNGRSNSTTIGSNENTYIVINDNANIHRSIYAGGNYGANGTNSSLNSTESKIVILNGTIGDSVYGGANQNGAGTSSKPATITIDMYGGTVAGSIYGGSNVKGVVYGSTNINIIGGTVSNNIYGGGKGGYSTNLGTTGTYVGRNVKVTIGDKNSSKTPTITGSVYGGSAFGTVNSTTNPNSASQSYTTEVTVNKGTIANVFGGGQGSLDANDNVVYTPYIAGNITVDIDGGTITNVYGGNDLAGTPLGTVTVNLKGGKVTNTFGGGNASSVTASHVNLMGGESTTVYGGSNSSGTVPTTNIKTTSGKAVTIYGGNNLGGTTGNANIDIRGGNITTVYGGGRQANLTGGTNVDITNSTISGSVFGGGDFGSVADNTDVDITNSTINGSLYTGGNGNTATVSGNTTLTITATSSVGGNIFGGGNEAASCTGNDNTLLSSIDISGTSVGGDIYGGGNIGTTKATKIELTNSSVTGNLYGGGKQAGVANGTDVDIIDSTITGNLYGGGDNGAVGANTDVSITGSTIRQSIYTGGNGNTATVAGNTTLTTTGTTNVTHDVYGGGNAADSSTGTGTNLRSSVTMNGAVIGGNVFGGGNIGNTQATIVSLTNADVTGSVYGGGKQAPVTNGTDVDIITSEIDGNLYGGGDNGAVGANTDVYILDSTIGQSIYTGGNGNTATVAGNTTLLTSGETNVGVDVYGGGNAANSSTGTGTNLRSSVTMNGAAIGGNVFGGGNVGTTQATIVSLTNVDVTGSVYGGGKQAGVANGTDVDIITSEIDGNLYGGGDEGPVGSNTDVNVTGSTIRDSIYAGGNGNTATVAGNTTLTTTGTTNVTHDVYGGGNAADSSTGTGTNLRSSATMSGAVIGGNVFGGGNVGTTQATIVSLTNADITGSVYGGGKQAGVANSTDVDIITSEIDGNLYGGGDFGSVGGNTDVNISGSTIGQSIYTGGNGNTATVAGNTTLTTTGSTNVTYDVYGGGNAADSSTGTGTNLRSSVTMNGATIGGNVFGGGNVGTTQATIVSLTNADITGSVYGGGKQAGVTNNTDVDIITSLIDGNLYGGGDNGAVGGNTDVYISGSTIGDSIYAGGNGNTATVTGDTKLVTIGVTNVTNHVYGGGNAAASSIGTATDLKSSVTMNGAVIGGDVFGGGNIGTTKETVVTLTNVDITGSVYGGGKLSGVANNTDVNIITSTIDGNLYGGGDFGSVGGNTDVDIKGSIIGNSIYVGGNGNTATVTGNTTLNMTENSTVTNDVYGGGNAADSSTGTGTNLRSSITIDEATIGRDIYGGGNIGTTKATIVSITDTEITGNVFGGGKQAGVTNGVVLDLISSEITGSVFGGGDFGAVGASTDLYVSSTSVGGSLHAGGNGNTAVVNGNTLLDIDGTTNVTNHVFGGGNAAATGTELNDNSTGVVNIAGATVGGNVYGGANTSVLYGVVTVNIGKNVVSNNSLISGNIDISGTVFGGGEANASGSTVYDFEFISVTNGITINIDGANHSVFNIDGSIFGSGNASSTTGESNITISNYGTYANYKKNVSIQRATNVTISNSAIELEGATDRTNEYSSVLFTLSRIDHLKLKNNSTLFLQTGANLLKHFSSLVDVGNTEVKANVEIIDNSGTVNKNTDNRLYMWEGKNLNIALYENISAYGEVDGMTFFGMYNHDRDGKVSTAFYDSSFDYGDSVTSSELYYFSNGSYVVGVHEPSHNIRVDGFYSNEESSTNSGTIKTYYIEPTPENAAHYMWVVGEAVMSYTVNLVASKYSTLGAVELPLVNYSSPNTTFTIVGFNYNTLTSGVSLVEYNQIPRIASSGSVADNVMSLVMKTSNTGWITVGSTTFKTNNNQPYSGTVDYYTENSTSVPSLFFYLYHSKNLSTAGTMGTATISLLVSTPVDDLNSNVQRLNITVDMARALYSTNEYEGAVTVGKQYDMFLTSTTNVTTKSSISTYYSLYIESPTTIYQTGYHRSLVSNYILPENTKITMIDFGSSTTPEYYYYVVTANDVVTAQNEFALHREASYDLSRFVKMGSSSSTNIYDDAAKNALYYDQTTQMAEEEFIFIVDFSESNITENHTNLSLLIELRNAGNQTLISVLGIQQSIMLYNLYYNSDAVVDVNASFSRNPIYRGENVRLNVTTNFIQSTVPAGTVYDTNFFNQKLGVKLSIYDVNNTQVDGYSLLGTYFRLNGIDYYPRVDGTYRINIAERVANVASNLQLITTNSNLASGSYTIKIESFGSPDGIYYGLTASDSVTIPFTFINAIYGLSITMPEHNIVIDKETGLSGNGTNLELFHVNYTSSLQNPNLKISLYRRDYTTEYSTNYVLVDILDYITNNLEETATENLYELLDNPISDNTIRLYMKENLTSGTYKIVVSLYDNNSFIGDAQQYIFIK